MDVPANSIFCGPVTHLLAMLPVLMKILSHVSAKRKRKGLRVSNYPLSQVVFKRPDGSEGVNGNVQQGVE